MKMLANLWYLVETIDRSTSLFMILTALLVRSVEQSIRQEVVNPNICTVWIYDCALMMVIYIQRVDVNLGLEAGMLDRSSPGIVVTRKVLERLFVFQKSYWKVTDLVA